jgi:hypothetical protein
MISCDLMGGLGNQLFQIFTAISYSISNNVPYVFLYSTSLGSRSTYWDTLLENIKCNTTNNPDQLPTNCFYEPSFRYTTLPISDNIRLTGGYFQSYKYFQDNRDAIFELCEIRRQKNLVKNELMGEVSGKLISMHFRMGDYKGKPEYHPILPFDYYNNALSHIVSTHGENYTILVFCEREDEIAVKQIVGRLNTKMRVEYVDFDIPDWKQLLMMSCCDINIIANSTFSWWGAYFNDCPVLYPSVWFGYRITHDVSDLFPKSWRKIDCEPPPINNPKLKLQFL